VQTLYQNLGDLKAKVDEWDKLAKLIALRLPRWNTLEALLAVSTSNLPVAAEVRAQRDALLEGRGLLTDPDPLPHLCDQLTSALRLALIGARSAWQGVYQVEMAALTGAEAWDKLSSENRQTLLLKHGIDSVPALTVGNEAEVLAAAQGRSLSQWALDQAGLPGRFMAARIEAAQLVTPKAQPVSLPKATLHDLSEVEQWLEEVRSAILAKLGDGPVVV
jgi:hypothetical protein